jgi:hypothetical protein
VRNGWLIILVLFFSLQSLFSKQTFERKTLILSQSQSSGLKFEIDWAALAFLGFPIMLENVITIAVVDFYDINVSHGNYVQNIIEAALPNAIVKGYDVQKIFRSRCFSPESGVQEHLLIACLNRSVVSTTQRALLEKPKPDIINFSLGFGKDVGEWPMERPCRANNWSHYPEFDEMATLLTRHSTETAIIAAAGNAGTDGKVIFPACLDITIASGALKETDYSKAAEYSNRAAGIFFSPPGGVIIDNSKNRYGTSFSAPLLTALMAVYIDMYRSGRCQTADPRMVFSNAKHRIMINSISYPVPTIHDIRKGCAPNQNN